MLQALIGHKKQGHLYWALHLNNRHVLVDANITWQDLQEYLDAGA